MISIAPATSRFGDSAKRSTSVLLESLKQLEAAHQSELTHQEAEIRQKERLSAEEQSQALSALQKELETRYQSQLQAQNAWHAQTLSAQKSTYTKLQGDLQQTELSKLRKELAKWQSANEGPHELKVY